MESIDTAAVFAASVVVVNATVAMLKHPALGDVWRDVLPWWGRLVIFAVAALVSTTAQALDGGVSPTTAVALGLGAVGTAVMGHEFKGMIADAMKERAEERAEEKKNADG